MKIESKENSNNQARGFWYEITEGGERLICFRAKVHGKRFIRKLKLPENVKELEMVV